LIINQLNLQNKYIKYWDKIYEDIAASAASAASASAGAGGSGRKKYSANNYVFPNYVSNYFR